MIDFVDVVHVPGPQSVVLDPRDVEEMPESRPTIGFGS